MHSKKELIENNIDKIKQMLSESRPLLEISRKIGVKYDTLVIYLRKLKIPYSTNQNRTGIAHHESRVSAIYYIENNKPIASSRLKKKLIEEGFKEKKCERCGITEWMGEEVPLELHHIDGNHYNNKLENLTVLCSNCHKQLHGYNQMNEHPVTEKSLKPKRTPREKRTKIFHKENRFCVVCGRKLTSSQKKYCSRECLHNDVGQNPGKEELQRLIDNGISNQKIGQAYGVSEAAVRKWRKNLNI